MQGTLIFIAEDDGIFVTAVYRLAADGAKVTKVSGGLKPMDELIEYHRTALEKVCSWHNNLTVDAFGGG